MSDDWTNSQDKKLDHDQDQGLEEILKNFRSSVHAWSEDTYSRPHLPIKVHHASWRVAAAWALGCVLVSGSVAGGLFEHYRHQELAKIAAAAQAARQQRLADDQRAQSVQKNEDLLAKVDSDVSRTVPSAMEPLAQLMIDDSAAQ